MKKHLIIVLSIFYSTIMMAQDLQIGSDKFELIVRLENADSNERIDGVNVYLYSSKNGTLVDTKVSEYGLATFYVDPQYDYEVRTCSPDYFRNGMSVYNCGNGLGKKNQNLGDDENDSKLLCAFGARSYAFAAGGGEGKPDAILKATIAMSPMQIGSILELENVYYDLDKAYLRREAKLALNDLADIMSKNHSITIELSSHTDSRASAKYNMDLSERRAQSCFNYLVSKGISADRIIPKGYGESKLVNECADGVKCPDYKHQQNRRTEIEILTYEPITCEPSMDVDFNQSCN